MIDEDTDQEAERHQAMDSILYKSEMTIRDQFAMAALIGMLMNGDHHHFQGSEAVLETIAEDSYQLADAMLRVRNS